jgi:hypothetical protein
MPTTAQQVDRDFGWNWGRQRAQAFQVDDATAAAERLGSCSIPGS